MRFGAGTAAGLVLCATAAGAQSIVVGPNVWVSSAMPGSGQYEVILAADPADPNLLLAGAMVWRAEEGIFQTAAYASRDGGNTWKQTLHVDRGLDTQDPAVAYGPDHTAYFASWGNDTTWNIRTLLSASRDDGRSWLPPEDIITLDREFITVDNTAGRYRGRVYINGQSNERFYDSNASISSIWILRFDPMLQRLEPTHYIAASDREITIPTNGVVLADGTYITGFVEHNQSVGSPGDSIGAAPNATLKIIRSTDGGSRFSRAVVVADLYDKFGQSNVSSIPWLAADVSPTSRLRGRLYAVWGDVRSGRSEIWLARSEDGGDHWTSPIRVNDDEARAAGGGPDDFHPVVAVNNAGVVGVMWYDRRDNPDNTGWWVRFAASVDGGETFSPSIRVSEAPFDIARDTQPVISAITRGGGHPHPLLKGGPLTSNIVSSHFNFVGGHTAGLAATSDGIFHPLWIDDRTGISQIYTAAVRVIGSGAKQSSATGTALRDVSQNVILELSHARYISRDSLVTVKAVLRNTSRDTLRGPFELRIRSLKSDLGEIRLVDDGKTAPAASSRAILLAGPNVAPLLPGDSLPPVRLVFHVAHPANPVTPTDRGPRLVGYGVTLVSLESNIFGRSTATGRMRP